MAVQETTLCLDRGAPTSSQVMKGTTGYLGAQDSTTYLVTKEMTFCLDLAIVILSPAEQATTDF